MKTDTHTTPQPRGVSYSDVKFTLAAFALQLAFVIVYFIFALLAPVRMDCDPCTIAQLLFAHVKLAVGVGLALVILLFPISIPCIALPPIIGLVIDLRRAARREGGGRS